ncbi:MAG: hypothetical protein US83_C0009G0039 [Candidatus Falkowbacteria bacterium GW2011_GWC2_38_22]|nr:MAG: hypothetical protein US83_C0009G0039 [Candidatus Falkowbacteria bacterium GW2011_GWC2_38_22]
MNLRIPIKKITRLWPQKFDFGRKSRFFKFAAGLLVFIVIGGVFFVLNPFAVKAAWWNDSWLYRRAVPIDNDGGEQSNVRVSITLDTAALIGENKLRADCGDMRFAKASGEPLEYFLASGCNTATTTVWLKYDYLPDGGQTAYFYYGNPSAASASALAQFNVPEAASFDAGNAKSEEVGPSPALYYQFDEAGGDIAIDAMNNAHPGTITGASRLPSAACVAGACLSFDGTNDEISVTNAVPIVKTIQFWVRTATGSNYFLDLNCLASVSSDNYTLSANNFDDPTIYVNGRETSAIIPGQWNFVTITSETATATVNLAIGKIGTDYYAGHLDELKIYPYVRTQSEVKQDYAVGQKGYSSLQGSAAIFGSNSRDRLNEGLVAYYQMDDTTWATTSNSVTDDSLYNNHARPFGNASTTASGKFSRSGAFDGYGDYLTASSVPLMSDTGQITISSWINPSDTITATSGVIQDLIDDGTHRIFMDTDGTLKFTIDSDTPEQFTDEKGETEFGGLNGTVYAMAEYNNELYVGGDFKAAGGVFGRNYIAKWDGRKWHTVGTTSDINSIVRTLAVYNGSLYVGGWFTNVAGITGRDYFARWDGNIWNTVGAVSDINDNVLALAVYNGTLYVGGAFTNAAGVTNRNYIARWDGSTWNTVGAVSNINSHVLALAVYSGSLYVGGIFTNAAGVTNRNYIARWDGSTWNTVGAVSNINSYVYALAVYNGSLYVGGGFTNVAGVTGRNRIARWDGSSWNTVGAVTNINERVLSLAVYNGSLYVGGWFTNAAGVTGRDYIARWDGSSWNTVGVISNLNYGVHAISVYNGSLYVGGEFTNVASVTGRDYIARWDGSIWNTVGAVSEINDAVLALAVYNGSLYVGGAFTNAAGVTNRNYIARWDGSTWNTVGAVSDINDAVYALTVYNDSLYVGGQFTNVAGVTNRNNIARWDGSTWNTVGVVGDINSVVLALTVYNGSLYVGGQFINAAGVTNRNYIARWDSSIWNTVGVVSDINSIVLALAVYNGSLYVGGYFTDAAGVSNRNNIVRWDGTSWNTVGTVSDINNGVDALAVYNGSLYVGGWFTDVASTTGRDYLARWDGNIWNTVGTVSDINNGVDALAVYNGSLYVGGQFINAAGVTNRNYIARWDGSTWNTVGAVNNLNSFVNALAVYNGSLYVGGSFQPYFTRYSSLNDLSVTTSLPFSANWQNVSAVYDGYSARIYIDGILSGETLGSIRPKAVSQTNYFVGTGFGTSFAGANEPFYAGQLDDVRIYNRALSQSEVTALNNWAQGKTYYFKMDENQGSVLYNASGVTADFASTTGAWTRGKINSGVGLDGASASALISNFQFPISNQFSISEWFNFQTLATGKPIISHWGNSQNDVLIKTSDINSDEITVCIAASGTDDCANGATTTAADLVANTWYHIHVAYDGTASGNNGRLKVYLNGAEQALGFTGTILATIQNLEADLELGGDADLGVYSHVKLDEFMVYGYTRTQAQGYSDLRGCDDSGEYCQVNDPLMHLQLNEGKGTLANNFAGAFDGTVNGATWPKPEECLFGSCLSFDGTNDSLDVSGTIPLIQTIQFWVKTATGVSEFIDLNGLTSISSSNNTVATDNISNPTIYVNGGVSRALVPGQWNMITVTTETATSAIDLAIGKIGSACYSGYMDEIKIYPYVRSAAEIRQDYSTGLRGYASQNSPGATFGTNGQGRLNNGLVAHYQMDEASWSTTTNSALDSSIFQNNARPAGDASTTASGKFSRGANFDGYGDYLTASSAPLMSDTGQITISSWINPSDTITATSGVIQDLIDDGTHRIFMDTDGTLKFTIDSDTPEQFTNEKGETEFGGLNGTVYAMAEYDNELYVGGYFQSAGGVTNRNYIARWNGSVWNTVGAVSDINDTVNALAVYNGSLYVGGAFTNAAGVTNRNRIARWDGTNWNTVGAVSDINNTVRTLAVYNGSLYVGGSFTSAAGVTNRNYIARWDGSTWNTVGATSNLNSVVYALATYNGSLYVGGNFTNAAGTTGRDYIARWDGSTWNTVGATSNLNSVVSAFAIYNGSLYVGGWFTNAAGTTGRDYIARWDGSTWNTVGAVSDINGDVYALAVYNGSLYVGGDFTNVANTTGRNYLARWDGSVWNTVGAINNPNSVVRALATYNGSLYVGGLFSNFAGVSGRNNIARWDGNTWNTVGTVNDISGEVKAFAIYNSSLYIVGSFTNVAGITGRNYIARWDGSTWNTVGDINDINGITETMAVYNNSLYVGGFFNNVGGVLGCTNLARWDGSAWSTVGAGNAINNRVYVLAVYKNSLYVGGMFSSVAGLSGGNNIARWDGSAWNTVGLSSINNHVYALVVYNNSLYVGGIFTNVGGIIGRNYLARWDGSIWNTVGAVSDINYYVYTLGIYNGSLYVGGDFTNVAGITGRNYITRWNGSIWNTVGVINNLNDSVSALAVYNGDLFVGGFFKQSLLKYSSNNDLSVSATLNNINNAWQNVTAVYDGYSAKIYIDGVFSGETIGSIRPKAVSQTNYFVGTGFGSSAPGASPGDYAGQLDDVRIYNRALNQNEITSLNNWSPGQYVHLKIDERQGSVLYDASGNNMNGTSTGVWVDGKINSGISLNGTNGTALISNFQFPISNQFSISNWFNFQTLGTGKPIISHWGGGENNILIKTSDINSDEISVCIAASGSDNCANGATTTAADLRAGDWNHLHLAYNGASATNADRLKLYLNGLYQPMSFTGTISSILQNPSRNLELGANVTNSLYSHIKLDDFQVYHYAQPQSKFSAEFFRGQPVHWWKFAECSGTRIGDSRTWLFGELVVGSSGTQTIAGDCASSSASSARYNGREGMFSGKAINFDGTDDYASTSLFSWPDTAEMSLSFWVNPNVLATAKPIVSQWNGSANSLLIKTDDSDSSRLRLCIAASGVDNCANYAQTPAGTLANGAWKHIFLTYKGAGPANADRLKVYANGMRQTLSFGGTIPSALQNPSSPSLKFAGDPYLTTYANVKMDEIKVWNYALDDFAVKSDYNGGEVMFGKRNPWTCGTDELTDIDGNSYATVQIGTQCWMAENLMVSKNADGSAVNGTGDVDTTPPEAYGDVNWQAVEGYLYNWQDAMNGSTVASAQGICPTGWHVPSHDEWTDLDRYICNAEGNADCDTVFPKDTTTTGYLGTNEGAELKADAPVNGIGTDPNGDDGYSFAGRLAGYHHGTSGSFLGRGTWGNFWSSSESGTNAWCRRLVTVESRVERQAFSKGLGWSVRCLKD